MFKYIPYIHKIKKDKIEENQIPLYIENYPILPPKEESKKENIDNPNIIIIQL